MLEESNITLICNPYKFRMFIVFKDNEISYRVDIVIYCRVGNIKNNITGYIAVILFSNFLFGFGR